MKEQRKYRSSLERFCLDMTFTDPVTDPVIDPVTDPVVQLLKLLTKGEFSSGEMRARLGIKHRATFRDNYIHPALSLGLIIQTIPDKPNSRLQKYKLTERAKHFLKGIKK